MCELAPSSTNPAAPVCHFGAGFTPEGFQVDYLPRSKVQPFLSNNGGFIYYADRVLSPQGSQWMYTIDFGAGINIFVRAHDAVTFGYRDQHLPQCPKVSNSSGSFVAIVFGEAVAEDVPPLRTIGNDCAVAARGSVACARESCLMRPPPRSASIKPRSARSMASCKLLSAIPSRRANRESHFVLNTRMVKL